MIRPLRQRHRRIVVGFGILLPIAFATGIVARKPVPVVASLPAALIQPSSAFAAAEWGRSDLFARTHFKVQLRRENAGSRRLAVEFFAGSNFVKPDLIVYWIAGDASITDSVPDSAQLLGGFVQAEALPLPEDAATRGGRLMLYSLADQEIIDVSIPLPLPKP
jgi:hypothetical protein